MYFKNIFAEKFGKNGVFGSKQSQILQKFDHIIGFEKNANFFSIF
jgi:hypothetical protein